MIRRTGIVLWVLVLIAGGFWVYSRGLHKPGIPGRGSDPGHPVNDGRAFATLPWKQLPQMRPIRMTGTDGRDFDSASLHGQPYVISFFFANCPTICQDLNRQIRRLANEFRGSDLKFLSLSVDPENDTPENLLAYGEQFEVDADQWKLLSGPMHRVRQVGEQQFNVVVDGVRHSGDLFLVDRWGRYRDRFDWDNPDEMLRFSRVVDEVLAESEPPMEKLVETRNILASIPHSDRQINWLNDFQLIDEQGQPFWSRDLTGQVQIVSFFFSTCPGVCPRQNAFLAGLQGEIAGRDAWLISITTDPETDDPTTLRQYARSLGAGDHWKFLTGDLTYIRRVGSEMLGIAAEGEHHSSRLVVIDRWGNVRARVDWQAEGSTGYLTDLIDRLDRESQPIADPQVETWPGGSG